MKKINNKGFTLIEMIIAMTIFGIVISLGYGIFNSSQKAFTEQKEVFNGQTTMNLINKFLSKDLEVANGISNPLNSDGNDIEDLQVYINTVTLNNPIKYTYKINLDNLNNKIITYIVDIELKGDDYIYHITRVDENNSTIKILSNKTSFKDGNIVIPFDIDLEDGSYNESGEYTDGGIYNIEVSYKDKNKKNTYNFSVKSRIG